MRCLSLPDNRTPECDLARTLRTRLHAETVSDIYKRVARWVGLPAKHGSQVSGHSIRIGATQDLLALNIDLASVMQAGRWKSTAMPMRYGEEILAARGGMARAAQAQSRDGAAEESQVPCLDDQFKRILA